MSDRTLQDSVREHRACWELLPWLANERASAADTARVEAHLRTCAECRSEIEVQRRLRDAMRTDDALVIAPQAALQKLMQRIDAQEQVGNDDAAPAPPPARWSRVAHAISGRRGLMIAAAVQALAISALLAALWIQSREMMDEPRYTTLTSQSQAAGTAHLRMVLAPEVTVASLNDLLRSIDAQVLSGPSEAGVYTLSLGHSPAGEHAIAQLLARLRTDPRVRFAEAAPASP